MANSRRSQSRYDLIACDQPWFREMGYHGRLLPLDGLMADKLVNLEDIYPDALASSRHGGRQLGIPMLMTGEVLAYRTDLMQERGMEPPRKAEDVVEAARRLHDPARVIFGITWNCGRGTALGHSFIMMMGAFGRPIVPVWGYALGIPTNIPPSRIDSVWEALCVLTSSKAVKLYLSWLFSVDAGPGVPS